MRQRLLIIHPIIAPYRIDFFNCFTEYYDTQICLTWRNLHDQKFDYKKIEEQFLFKPIYLTRKILGYPLGLFKILWRFKPDIILVSECGIIPIIVILLAKLCLKNVKVISIIDDSYDMISSDNHFTMRHKYAEKCVIPFFDNIINVEPRVVEHFQRRYKKGIFFPIIVDEKKATSRYIRILPISEKYIQEYSLENKKVILFVGRLVEIKNVQFVISALKDIDDRDIRFVIVGSGEYEKTLYEMAQNDQRIIFTGRKEGDELYAWYNVAQLFTLPSYQEAFGAVTNEALLGGCRCLVSNKAGSQCLIKETANGRTFDPYNIKAFQEILRDELHACAPLPAHITKRESLMNITFQNAISHLTNNL